ncbi:MAG: tetratricopeptide repeat protein [Candidatus Latescibacterota bacterium]
MLVLALACASAAQLPPAPASSEAQRAAARRFWQVYAEATQARVARSPETAVALYQEAVRINPGHEDALYYLGSALFETGRFAQAEDAWRRLVAANPASARAHLQLGMLYSCAVPGAPLDLDRAAAECERAMALNREETGAAARLGEVEVLRGEHPRALELLSGVARSNPRSIQARYLLGYLHWKAGRQAQSEAALDQAVALARTPATPQPQPGAAQATPPAGEGDTRKGAPLLGGPAPSAGPLAAAWGALAERPGARLDAGAEYGRLDEDVQRLRRRAEASRGDTPDTVAVPMGGGARAPQRGSGGGP